jgi:hypothetical protein
MRLRYIGNSGRIAIGTDGMLYCRWNNKWNGPYDPALETVRDSHSHEMAIVLRDESAKKAAGHIKQVERHLRIAEAGR